MRVAPMGCCPSRSCFGQKDGPIRWFSASNQYSLDWQYQETGFGSSRNKSFQKGVHNNDSVNRRGNEYGELAGRIVFFCQANTRTNYLKLDKKPTVRLKQGSKMFAKAFLHVPVGRMPIGENNIVKTKPPLPGYGPALLAPCIKAVALFVKLDGEPIEYELFSNRCAEEMREYYEGRDYQPELPSEGIPGSFFTYLMPRTQDKYFFFHFPIVAGFNDINLSTGNYGDELVSAFCELYASQSPGVHTLDLDVRIYYDHVDFNYFPLDKNLNARGKWYSDLSNKDLQHCHYDPYTLDTLKDPVAKGSCYVVIPKKFTNITVGILDRRPPKNRYNMPDIEAVLKDAKVVATGHFSGDGDSGLKMEGMPDCIVPTTGKLERRDTVQGAGSGYAFKYEYIEFAALWFNKKSNRPNEFGTMLEGSLARGEVGPRQFTRAWGWFPIKRKGNVIPAEKIDIKNCYIRRAIEKMAECVQKLKANDELDDVDESVPDISIDEIDADTGSRGVSRESRDQNLDDGTRVEDFSVSREGSRGSNRTSNDSPTKQTRKIAFQFES